MSYSASVICDSVNPAGSRLTSMALTYPRFVHSELMTHRQFSRSSSSSRAIPISTFIARVLEDPVVPVHLGRNQPGMQAGATLSEADAALAVETWLDARDNAVESARTMARLGVHKQVVNRLLEPWMWITVLVSATEWGNFFALRCSPLAQPEIERIATMARDARDASTPQALGWGQWHLPYLDIRTDSAVQAEASTARCARVSYLTHEGKRDLAKDIALARSLVAAGHMSPFEHVARADREESSRSNYHPSWHQYRKDLPFESDFSLRPAGEP